MRGTRFLLLPLIATLGCAATQREPPPVDDWLDSLDEIANARCARAVRCADDRGLLYHDDVCRPPALAHAYWRHVFADGERVLDEARAATCLAGLLADTPCWYTAWEPDATNAFAGNPVPWECETLTRPGRRVGESCWNDGLDGESIAFFRTCEHGECVAGASCGATCVAFASEGGSCARVPCADGLHCDPSLVCVRGCTDTNDCEAWPDGAVCVAGDCIAAGDLPRAGEACAIGVDTGPTCARGARCREDGRCGAIVPLGAACDPSTSACDGLGVCDPTTLRCAVPCGAGTCGADEPYCTVTNTCSSDPVAMRCPWLDGWLGDDRWPPGYQCAYEPTGARCAVFAAEGAACDASVVCAPGTTCASNVCVRRVVPWATCASDAVCPSAFECVASACVYRGAGAFVPLGWPCDATTACSGGQCVDGACAMPGTVRDGEYCDPRPLDAATSCAPGFACTPTTYLAAASVAATDWVCRAACEAP